MAPEQTTNADVAAAILALAEKLQAPTGISKEDLQDVMESNSEGMRRALKPENARHPDVSAFNTKGERDFPRPALRRKTFMSPGFEVKADDLTREEIELLNQFDHNTEAHNGQWRAELKRTASDGTQELHIVIPSNTVDERMDLPKSMSLILRELLGGTQAVDAESLAQRVAQLEAQLKAQTA
jgi:hypothetical protein